MFGATRRWVGAAAAVSRQGRGDMLGEGRANGRAHGAGDGQPAGAADATGLGTPDADRAPGHLIPPRDWAWRNRIRANPQSHEIYKWIIGGLGLVVTVGGLIMVPLPGPGWLVVFIGVSIWASEFHWARRLHTYGLARLRRWNDWILRQNLWIRGAVVVATCLFVNAVIWTTLKLGGVPGWIPPQARAFLTAHLAL